MDGWIGQIISVGFNYEPPNWLKCDGRPLPIDQYQALFSLIGTTYGGDGISNFRIPDMRGRLPMKSCRRQSFLSRIQKYFGNDSWRLHDFHPALVQELG
jgi:microcystin-dependent protein